MIGSCHSLEADKKVRVISEQYNKETKEQSTFAQVALGEAATYVPPVHHKQQENNT